MTPAGPPPARRSGGVPLGNHVARRRSRWRSARPPGSTPGELAAVVPHQANLRIINALARQIGAANAVVADDVVDAGNTSAASVPLALARLRREGKVTTGDLALTLAFGAGLTWAGSSRRPLIHRSR